MSRLVLFPTLLAILAAAPALALHRESPPAVRVTSSGSHTLSRGKHFTTNAVAFVSDQDLLANGSTGQQIFVFSQLFYDCNAYTTRSTTPCPHPPRDSLFQVTHGPGNPANPTLVFRQSTAYIAFDADGSFVGLQGPAANLRQIFLMNLITGELVTVTRSSDGNNERPSLNISGSVVVFESTSRLTRDPQPAGVKQIYAYKRFWLQGVDKLLRITSGAADSTAPIPDKTGTRLVFQSRANLLADGADTGVSQIFAAEVDWDTLASSMFQITRGNADSTDPYVADDHRFVVFESQATDLPDRFGSPGGAIFSAPTDEGHFPRPKQLTDVDTFGECHSPTLSFTDQRVGFICTGDPLRNGTTGNRYFVLSIGDNTIGTLQQVTGRGDVQAASMYMGESFAVLSDNANLAGSGACGYQIYIVDIFRDPKSGFEVYHAATSLGDLPEDLLPPPPVEAPDSNALGKHTFGVAMGTLTGGSQMTVSAVNGQSTVGVSYGTGHIRLEFAPRSPFTGEASLTAPFDNEKIAFPPVDVPGLGTVCIDPRGAGTGMIDCDGGHGGATVLQTQWHGNDPGNPACIGGCFEVTGRPLCDFPGPHRGACRGPILTSFLEIMAPGTVLLDVPATIAVSTFPGLDGLSCTPDDAYTFQGLNIDLHLTTGTATTTINGLEAGEGSISATATGIPLSCPRIVRDDLEGGQLVGIVPLPDIPNVGGELHDVLLTLRLEAGRLPEAQGCSSVVCNSDGDCSDGSPCNGVETCENHICVAGTSICDDADLCNGAERCDPVTGACLPTTPPDCDDGSPCTTDACSPTLGCIHTPTCSDGNPCNGLETCNPVDGTCGPGTAPRCDDFNDCTEDSCSALLGCISTPTTGNACSDGDACTSGDICQQGVCIGRTAVNCDDGNICNGTEICDPATGGCLAGDPIDCNDDNPCTDDACKPGVGCQHTPNTAPCNDGNLCTANDTCAAGTCKSGPPIVCTDGNQCNGEEVCDPRTGECAAGPAPNCNDNDECTTDTCDPVKGCTATPVDNHTACVLGRVFSQLTAALTMIQQANLPSGVTTALSGPIVSGQRRVHTAAFSTGARQRKFIARATKKLIRFVRVRDNLVRQGQVSDALSAEIDELIHPAAIDLQTL